MNKETILSLVRTILTAISAFVVGKHLFGTTVDDATWQGWVGVVVGLGSSIWGIVDKSATIEGIQSALRSAIIVVGGLFVAKGSLTADQLTSILGAAMAIIPFLYSTLSKQKSASIANGNLPVSSLKK